MNKRFRILFIASWIITFSFLLLNVIYGFAAKWLTVSLNYLYISSLICLYITSDFLKEKTTNSEKLVVLENYDIWGFLFIIASATGLLLYIGFKSSVILVMSVSTFFISIWIIIKYRKLISKTLIVNALVIGTLSCIAVYKYIPSLIVVFISMPCFFISASLLNEKFQIISININKRLYNQIIKSFFIGCFFGLPMAISNLSDVISSTPDKWLNQFWQPILALNAVTLEETWVRLFIITFIYAFISSKTNRRYIPIITAILISSIIFGFTHYPHVNIQNCFNIMVLYGLPLGVLLYKRDFETVIGYHFIIDFMGAIAAFLINSNTH